MACVSVIAMVRFSVTVALKRGKRVIQLEKSHWQERTDH